MTQTYHIDRIVVEGAGAIDRSQLENSIRAALANASEPRPTNEKKEDLIGRQIARAIREATDER